MPNPLLYALIFIVAVLYSSAGFGGASGYLLAMSFFDIPASVMSSAALVLNVFVSTISFTNYFRTGHFCPKLLLPFLITSIPAALTSKNVAPRGNICSSGISVPPTFVAGSSKRWH